MATNKNIKLIFFIFFSIFITGCQRKPQTLQLKQSSKKEEEMTRKAAVSGAFYPERADALKKQIDNYFSSFSKRVTGSPQILILPHAGYQYSGAVAAAGIKQIQNKNVSRVILLGASHRSLIDGAAIDGNDKWQTPLGTVAVDQDFADQLVEEEAWINYSSAPHQQEHSLEVEVPFLQAHLDDFKIVPILVGDVDNKRIQMLADLLWSNKEDSLLIISSDLSHYPLYKDAETIDIKTIEAIISGSTKQFDQIIKKQLQSGYQNLQTCACGEKPIKVAMKFAEHFPTGDWSLIKYANSGDTSARKDQVVGYGAIGYFLSDKQADLESKPDSEQFSLTQSAKQQLLKVARKTLSSYLETENIPNFDIDNPELKKKLGVFVTLRKNGRLRGCIGKFEPDIELWRLVQQKAIDAATKDPRFQPLTKNELDQIELEISVLSKPKEISDWKKIEPGRHGVIIKKGRRGGTFLPQVATENNWDRETFLSSLCLHKAGLAAECYKDPTVKLFIYTAEVFQENRE
jgi:hypothetical protein